MLRRKVYDDLLNWKSRCSGRYAAFLDGAGQIGKSAVAAEFAGNEYRSYIIIDFACPEKDICKLFDNISNMELFFLRLQAITGITLYERNSVIIFDDVHIFPKARKAIKTLVKDRRYDYIETGLLAGTLSKGTEIRIMPEEYWISMYPMDFEEFLWACGKDTYDVMCAINDQGVPAGETLNRSLMREFRIYMAVGGMPQAVEAYIQKKSFNEIDIIKRGIIARCKDCFNRADPTGHMSLIFESIPEQIAADKRRFVLSKALNMRTTHEDKELLSRLADTKTVLVSCQIKEPGDGLIQSSDMEAYKLYIFDTGLLATMMYQNHDRKNSDIYINLLSGKSDAAYGYLYENAVAQIISSKGNDLFYYTWDKKNSSHYYEIDFITGSDDGLVPIEIRPVRIGSHDSISEFSQKYASRIARSLLLSQKDIGQDGSLQLRPIYLAPVILD